MERWDTSKNEAINDSFASGYNQRNEGSSRSQSVKRSTGVRRYRHRRFEGWLSILIKYSLHSATFRSLGLLLETRPLAVTLTEFDLALCWLSGWQVVAAGTLALRRASRMASIRSWFREAGIDTTSGNDNSGCKEKSFSGLRRERESEFL